MVLEIGRRGMQEPDVCSKLHNKILLRKKKAARIFSMSSLLWQSIILKRKIGSAIKHWAGHRREVKVKPINTTRFYITYIMAI